MSSILNQIQPHVELILNQLSSLPAVAIDTSSHLTNFVQQLLSNSNFFGAVLQSEGRPQVVVLDTSSYQTIQSVLGCLPRMARLIQLTKLIASASANQLHWNIVWMGVGTLLLTCGLHKIAQITAPEAAQSVRLKMSPEKMEPASDNKHTYLYKAVVLAGVSAIVYSMYKTYDIAQGLQGIS